MSETNEQNFPDFLKLTPERLAENEAYQKLWSYRATSPFVNNTARMLEKANAVREEKELLPIIEAYSKEVNETTDEKRKKFLVESLEKLYGQLAEKLASQGRFDEAAAIEPDLHRRTEYMSFWIAVWRQDAESCECVKKYEDKYKTYYVEKFVFSLKHGVEMPIVRCNTCGLRNVKALLYDLGQSSAKRAEVRRLTDGQSIESATRTLQAAGFLKR